MIKLYFHTSPNPKPLLMVEEAGLPYIIVPIDTRKGEQHSAAYRKINPNARTPAIEEDGVRMFDSTAILLHLAEMSGRFLGATAARREMLSWLMFIATGIAPMGGQLVHFSIIHPDSAYAQNRYRREVERLYSILDERLRDTPYLGGAEYTIADISAWPWIRITDFVLGGEGQLARWPALATWFAKVDGRPAASRASEIAAQQNFKTDFDDAALRALFPQNYPAAD
jgi:GSH-dependent disulfide-bond oxidoreductase